MYRFFSKKRGFLNILLKNPYLGMHRGGGPDDAGRAQAVPAAAPQFDNGESAILQ